MCREEDVEALIEKLAIITYLHSYEFRHYLHGGVNPFHEMFSSRYEYLPMGDLFAIYFEKLEKYKKDMEDAFFKQLKRMRLQSFGGRQRLESYKITTDRIEKKRLTGYEYIVDAKQRHLQMMYSYSMIMKRIFYNIWKREQEGVDQIGVRLKLSQFFQRNQTIEGYNLFCQLFAEANAQLNLLVLPQEFIKYKEVIYK
jgi:hypothetical protein